MQDVNNIKDLVTRSFIFGHIILKYIGYFLLLNRQKMREKGENYICLIFIIYLIALGY
jgi:hypothetical protein